MCETYWSIGPGKLFKTLEKVSSAFLRLVDVHSCSVWMKSAIRLNLNGVNEHCIFLLLTKLLDCEIYLSFGPGNLFKRSEEVSRAFLRGVVFPEQFIVEIGEENDAAWPRKLLQMLVLSKCRECVINTKCQCAPTPPCGGGVPVPLRDLIHVSLISQIVKSAASSNKRLYFKLEASHTHGDHTNCGPLRRGFSFMFPSFPNWYNCCNC